MGDRPRIPSFLERLPVARRAFAYAERLHAGQVRAFDESPFVVHVLEVAALLHHAGAPEHLVAAGILHDTLEKSSADAADLRHCFGAQITSLVVAVSEDPSISEFSARKAALRAQVARAGEEAQLLFAADKVSKVRELRLEMLSSRSSRGRTSTASRARHMAHYRECLHMLEALLPDAPLVRRLRDELATTSGAVLPVTGPVGLV